MAFTFVHTADWQLGKVFGQFAPDTAAVLRQARLDIIDRIAAVAREGGATHILVAGDVFDSETPSPELIAKTLARLALQRDVVWHLTAGNHDPARAGGVWELVAGQRQPPNVRLHLTPVVAELANGVCLLPASLTAKAMSTDPTLWMSEAATPAGSLRIGMAHGSIRGFGSLGEAAVQIDPERAKAAGLDFLALGDWHGTMQVGPYTWYSGTPEADSYADNSPGNVLLVTVERTAAAVVKVMPTSQFRWREQRLTVHTVDSLAAIETEIAHLGMDAANALYRLNLSGSLPLAAAEAFEARLAAMAAIVRDLRIDKKDLSILAGEDDIASLGEPGLIAVAQRLSDLTRKGGSAEQGVAERALQRLAHLARTASAGA